MPTHQELIQLAEKYREEYFRLCKELIQIPSVNPPGDTEKIVNFIAGYLRGSGIETELLRPAPRTTDIIARLGSRGGRTLILNGHCDVVPVGDISKWEFDPFSGEVKDGWLLGRGASDMKAGLAGLLLTAVILHRERIPLKGEIVLTVVPDEEVSGDYGTRYLVENKIVTGDACLVAEPHGKFACEIGQKGCCWFKFTAEGKSAHGSLYPYAGESAIEKLLRLLNALGEVRSLEPENTEKLAKVIKRSENMVRHLIKAPEGYKAINHVTVNIGTVRGGTKINMVPDYAEAEVDIRLPQGVSTRAVEEKVREIMKETGTEDIRYEFLWRSEPNRTEETEEIVQTLAKAMQSVYGEPLEATYQWAGSDARYFRYAGIPTLQYGPCYPEGIHGYNEKVDAEEAFNALKLYLCTVTDYLNR